MTCKHTTTTQAKAATSTTVAHTTTTVAPTTTVKTTTPTTALQDDTSRVEQTQTSGTPEIAQPIVLTAHTAPAPSQELAHTGLPVGPMLILGVGLVVIGAELMRVGRKVRPAFADVKTNRQLNEQAHVNKLWARYRHRKFVERQKAVK